MYSYQILLVLALPGGNIKDAGTAGIFEGLVAFDDFHQPSFQLDTVIPVQNASAVIRAATK